MPELFLYDTLTRSRRRFESIEPDQVRMYTCGPTVYRYIHIGNLRSFLLADWLRRTLTTFGYTVKHIKNITDVGHMRQELLDAGEDKLIAAARAEGKTAMQIADFYTDAFRDDERQVNILPSTVLPRATDHIAAMVAMIEQLLERGLAYIVDGTIYFDVTAFPSYGKLSGNQLEAMLSGVRSEADPAKRRPEDFALWKAAEPGRDPLMTWESPWGPGFPGWHIECSAMSKAYLGTQLDIHTGGVDNIFPHHEGEIAQSEGANGCTPYVRFWVHGQHLLVDGLKMAKSTGNDYRLSDLTRRGYDPLAFRYLCATVHYRSRLNFTFAALRAAQRGLNRLRELVAHATVDDVSAAAIAEPLATFQAALADDLNLPQALATLWDAVHSLDKNTAAALALACDEVLGLGLSDWHAEAQRRQAAVAPLLAERETARSHGDFATADALRTQLEADGLHVHDTPAGPMAHQDIPPQPAKGLITSSAEAPCQLDHPDLYDITVSLVGRENADEVERSLRAVRATQGDYRIQVIALDNGSVDGTAEALQRLTEDDPDFVPLLADHDLGEGAGRNATFRCATGRVIVWLGNHVEPTGDVWTPLLQALDGRGVAQPVGAAGGWGLWTADRKEFEPSRGRRVDALEGYMLAFPRALLCQTSWLDEKFRFYRNLDIEFSFRVRKAGYTLAEVPKLPVQVHPHRIWESLPEGERQRRSKKNFDRFYKEWHHWRDVDGVLVYIEDFIRQRG